MQHLNHIPIWRGANHLMVEVEQTVRGFSCYHKFSIGTELRASVLRLCRTVHRAWSCKGGRLKLVRQVTEFIDDIKMQVQRPVSYGPLTTSPGFNRWRNWRSAAAA